GRVIVFFDHLRLHRQTGISNPDLNVLVTRGRFRNGCEVCRMYSAPECFLARILELAELRAKLRRRHAHQLQDVTILLALNRAGLTNIRHAQPRPVKRVIAISHDQSLMLWFSPLESYKAVA